MGRNQFTFYREYYESAKKLSRNDFVCLMDAICGYSLNFSFDQSKLPKKAFALFNKLRPELDKEIRLSAEGRRSAEYKAWRTSVYERDNYTCQLCGARGVKLNAHHKKAYAHYPELRFDINNGITLCVSCHKKIHRR